MYQPTGWPLVARIRLFLWCVLALTGINAAAQNSIQSVSTSSQGSLEVVRVETAAPLRAVPEGFIVQSPARIAFDFPEVASNVPRQALTSSKGNLRSVNVVQAGNRSRMVLNLQQSTNYDAKIEGNVLFLYLQPVTATAVPVKESPLVTAQEAVQLPFIKDIDFRKASELAGRVIVTLPNSQVGVDIKQQGKALLVQFSGVALPEGLRRRLDVADFGTPIQFVRSTQSGQNVQLLIEPKGNWEHSAYQSDTQFVLEVTELKVDPNKLTEKPGYSGEKLSLNFQNIEIRSLLQVIADFTSFNIVTSESVSGAVTLRLKDVPWDQALDIILQAKGLGVRKTGNVLWVAPKDELIAKEKQELEAKVNVESLEPLKTQVFQLKFAKAADVVPRLGGGQGAAAPAQGAQAGAGSTGLLSVRGSVSADPRTNQLFVTDIPSRLTAVQALLEQIDVGVQQVVIEARIVEANDSFGRSLGVRLGGADLRGVRGGDTGYSVGGGNRLTFGGGQTSGNQGKTTYSASDSSTGLFNNGGSSAFSNFVNLPMTPPAGSADDAVASLALTLFNPAANRLLSLEIQAMEAEGKGTIVSSPRLMTANQVTAIIEQGKEIPYTIQTDKGSITAFKKAVLKLEVTPQITPDGKIILDLQINKDSQGTPTPKGDVTIDTKAIKTQAIVENGGTVMLGGIFEAIENNSETKIPLLGDLPYVGNLFKSRFKDTSRKEMLVFITPRVLDK